MTAEVFGFLGGLLVSIGFVPQIIQVYRSKSAHDINLLFTILFLLGGFSWLLYGITSFVAALLFAKLKWGR